MWRKSTYRDDYGFGRYVPVAERRAKALDRELFAALGINANIRSMWVAAGVAE